MLVGHPFDTVKVHLQTQDHRNPVYRGTFHCLKTIIVKDSVRGLYRGISSPLGGIAFVNAIVFGVYGNVQRNTENPNSLQSHFFAGAAAGLAQSIVCSPMELIKTRLQLQNNQKNAVKFKSAFALGQHILRTEGARGVFKGLGITAARDCPGFSSYFVAYELMARCNENPSVFYTLMAGGLAGSFSWLVTFPLDTIKSRLQADGMSGKAEYSGIKDCVQKSYKNEGLSFLTRGLGSTLIRAFPMNAVCFLVVSTMLKYFGDTNIDLNIEHKPDSIALVAAVPTLPPPPLIMISRKSQHDIFKMNTIRSLIFLGAFSEAVCQSEIIDIANEMHEESQFTDYYFRMNDTIITETNTDKQNIPLLSD